MCNTEKHIGDFYKKYTECKECKRGLKLDYENKDKLSSQRKIYYETNYYRNKTIDVQTIKYYLDPMLNYKSD